MESLPCYDTEHYHSGVDYVTPSLPNGSSITNVYDSLARKTGTWLSDRGGTALNGHEYIYNDGHQRTKTTRTILASTNSVDYTYDPIGQLTRALGLEANSSARIHETFGYGYDAAMNLRYRTNNALVQEFVNNKLNQITNSIRTGTLTVAGTTSTMATNVTVNSQQATLYSDATFARAGFDLTNDYNSFTAIGSDADGVSDTNTVTVHLPASPVFQYDSNGNLTNDGLRAFSYDDENQLERITVTNVWQSEFVYDGQRRRRVRKEYSWDAGTTSFTLTNEVRYIYDGMLVVQERDGNNTPLVSYTRGLDLSGTAQGAEGIGGLLAYTGKPASESPFDVYYAADGNGNVTAMVNGGCPRDR